MCGLAYTCFAYVGVATGTSGSCTVYMMFGYHQYWFSIIVFCCTQHMNNSFNLAHEHGYWLQHTRRYCVL